MTTSVLQVLRRVKSRLWLGLRNRRFVQVSKTAGDRHRRWGVTAAFVLRVPTLRRFCGLVDSVVSPGDHDCRTPRGVKKTAPSPCSNGTGKDQSALEVPDALIPLRKTPDEEVSCTYEVIDHSSKITKGEKSAVHIQTSVLVHNLRMDNACLNDGTFAENATKNDKAGDCHEYVADHQTSSLFDLKPGAHDSAIDTTGFFEVDDSDSNDGSESSCVGLKRATSQESIGSHISSVSTGSWDMVIRNLNIRRSVSSDSLGSHVSSETDSALSTSEDDRSEDNDNDKRFWEDLEAANKDELYAVDDRHDELLGAIRWTCFEDLLKVLSIHAEEEGYPSAAGPGECVFQTPEPETSGDIVQQAFLLAMTVSSEDHLENIDVKLGISDTSAWNSSLALSTQLLVDCNSNNHESLVVQTAEPETSDIIQQAFLMAMTMSSEDDLDNTDVKSVTANTITRSSSLAVSAQLPVDCNSNHHDSLVPEVLPAVSKDSRQREELSKKCSSEYCDTEDPGDNDPTDTESSYSASSSVSDADSSDSETDHIEIDRFKDEMVFNSNDNSSSSSSSSNNNIDDDADNSSDETNKKEQDCKKTFCKASSGSDLDTSPTSWLQTGLNTLSHCPSQASQPSSAGTLDLVSHKVHENIYCTASPASDPETSVTGWLQTGLGSFSRCPDQLAYLSSSARTLGLVSLKANEVHTGTASVSASSSPSTSPSASPSRRCLELSFNSDDSDDSSERSPTSVRRRRHLISGYASPSDLPSTEALKTSYFGGGLIFSSRSSFDDDSQCDLSPGTSSSYWPFSDVFDTPGSRTIVDESAEASRWLEEHSADSSTYSPFMSYRGQSSLLAVPAGQCSGQQTIKSHFSLFREQATKPPRQESSSRGTSFPVRTSSTPSSLKGTQLVEVASPSSPELDNSEISFGLTGRLWEMPFLQFPATFIQQIEDRA